MTTLYAGYPAHPAAGIFPLVGKADLVALAADIEAHGLRHPITLLDGAILDGRNRALACVSAGVAPRFVEWDGIGSAVDFVLSENLRRRHLDESQRAMVGARAKPLYEAEARARHGLQTRPSGFGSHVSEAAAS